MKSLVKKNVGQKGIRVIRNQSVSSVVAFTLVELLVTLTLFVVIAAMVVPSFFATLQKAKDSDAVKRAALLDMAKANFRADKGTPYALEKWTNALSDQERYEFLRDYLSTAPNFLGIGGGGANEYTPKDYTYDLNTLTNRTAVRRGTNILVEKQIN